MWWLAFSVLGWGLGTGLQVLDLCLMPVPLPILESLVPGRFFLATLIPVTLDIPGSPDTSVCTLSPSQL